MLKKAELGQACGTITVSVTLMASDRTKKQGVAVGIHRAPEETSFDIDVFRDTADGENLNVGSVMLLIVDLWYLLVTTFG